MDQQVRFGKILRRRYPGISDHQVNNVINMVQEANPGATFEDKVTHMVNLLSGDGSGWGVQLPDDFVCSVETQVPAQEMNDEDKLNNFYADMMALFPDARPDFLWRFCKDRHGDYDLDDAMGQLVVYGYEKLDVVDPLIIWEQLIDSLPDADPSYLKRKADTLALMPPDLRDEFFDVVVSIKNYPMRKDFLE